jgi:hypothetical protein
MTTSFVVDEHVAADVLAALLGQLQVKKFVGDPERLHTCLARASRHYSILNPFRFTVGDVYPFSRDLEDALSILQRSRMIRMENPDYDTYVITANGENIGRHLLESFGDEEKQQLKELEEYFRLECGKEEIEREREAA